MATQEILEARIGSLDTRLSEVKTDIRELRADDWAVREKIDRSHTTLSNGMHKDCSALNAKIDQREAVLDRKIDQRTAALCASQDALRDRMNEVFRALDEKIEQRTKR